MEQTKLNALPGSARLKQLQNSATHHSENESAKEWPHVSAELSATATDKGIKDVILANFSDIPSTAEAAGKLQNLEMKLNELLIMYNSSYKSIHQVAFGLSPKEQYDIQLSSNAPRNCHKPPKKNY